MPLAQRKCVWRRSAALRGERTAEARACYQQGVRELLARGCVPHFDGPIRTKPINRVLATLLERGQATPALEALVKRFDNFARWCRRERSWIRQTVAVAKANGPERGP